MPRGKGLDYGNFFEKLNAKTQKDDENQEEKEKDHQVNDDPVEEKETEIAEPEAVEDDYRESDSEDDDYLDELIGKKKSETHRQETFRVEKVLLKELNKMYRKYGYGFKTKFINSAIRRELERIKELEKKRKS